MGLVFLLVLGGILGWLAAIVMDAEDKRDLALNVTAGVAGAIVAGLVVSPLIGGGTLLSGTYSISALMLSLVGALAAIAGANLYRHVKLRQARGGFLSRPGDRSPRM